MEVFYSHLLYTVFMMMNVCANNFHHILEHMSAFTQRFKNYIMGKKAFWTSDNEMGEEHVISWSKIKF